MRHEGSELKVSFLTVRCLGIEIAILTKGEERRSGLRLRLGLGLGAETTGSFAFDRWWLTLTLGSA
jgi:hypothetical protein